MFGDTAPGAPRIAILTYHSLDDSGSVLSTTPRLFAEQMRILRELHVTVVPLADVPRLLSGRREGRASSGPSSTDELLASITFDDGFMNVYEHGMPVLRQYGFPATVFLVSDYCGRDNRWPGQPPSIATRSLLGWAEARQMSEHGIAFGCHTRTHPNLRRMSHPAVEEELVTAKKRIEESLGQRVETFAYPYGAWDATSRRLAQTHFQVACSARLGFATPASDGWTLERLDMYYLRSPGLFRRLFSPEMTLYLGLRRGLRRLRGHGWHGG